MGTGVVIFLLILALAAYVIFLGMVAKPQWCVYAYLLVWIIIPKASRMVYVIGEDLAEDVTLFTFFEAASCLAILVALVYRSKHYRIKMYPLERNTVIVFLAASVISFLIAYGMMSGVMPYEMSGLWDFINANSFAHFRLLNFLGIIYTIVFFLGCVAFITTKRDCEMLLFIVVVTGIELVFEVVFLYYLQLIPPLVQWTMHKSGRFMSIIYTDFDLVGQIIIASTACVLYFIMVRKLYIYLLLLPLMMLPAALTFQRTPLLGLVASLILFFHCIIPQKKMRVFLYAGVVVVLLLLAVDAGKILTSAVGGAIVDAPRESFMSPDSFYGRMMLWARVTEIIAFLFPFGAGPGMVFIAMNYDVPSYLSSVLEFYVSDLELYGYYLRIATAEYTTGVHNVYLEHIAEFGLLGLISLVMFITAVVKNFLRYRRESTNGMLEYDLLVAQACVYAVLLGLALHAIFESASRAYFLYALFFFLSFRLRTFTGEQGNLRFEECREPL